MVFRSKARSSSALGILLTPRKVWYLRRHRRPPGVRAHHRRDPTGFRLDLRARRRLRHRYEIRDRQLARVLTEAARRGGERGENLIELLEQRLDALVWRAGFARSVGHARHLVGHNHFTVDGSKVNRPSYLLRPGQTIEVRESRRDKRPFVLAAAQYGVQQPPPPYLDVRPAQLRLTLTREPRRQEVPEFRDARFEVQTYSR